MIEGWPFIECLYMTVITISTVGFGEVRPLSAPGKLFTIGLVIAGIATISTSASFVFFSIVEGTLGEAVKKRRKERQLAKINSHFIICGLGAVGEDVVHEFLRAGEPFVIIDRNEEVLKELAADHTGVVYVVGNAAEEDVLRNAQIDRARGIIAVLGDDADNLYICLTARALNPKLRIIARVIHGGSIAKLKKAGADYVFSPEKIGGLRLAEAALKPTVTSFLDAILHGEVVNVVLEEVKVADVCHLAGTTLRDAAISRNIGIVIPAIKPAGSEPLVFNPSPDRVIQPGDTLITFGTPEQIKQLKKVCTLK
jgi:voltage-gated potassium channel